MSNFMKIHPVGTELLLADNRRADKRNEANSRSSQFWERTRILSPCLQHIHFRILGCIGDHVKRKYGVAAAETCVFQLG